MYSSFIIYSTKAGETNLNIACFVFILVHDKVGFGLMNAEKLVTYAEKWINVQMQEHCECSAVFLNSETQ